LVTTAGESHRCSNKCDYAQCGASRSVQQFHLRILSQSLDSPRQQIAYFTHPDTAQPRREAQLSYLAEHTVELVCGAKRRAKVR
jgi:hypothetical protein